MPVGGSVWWCDGPRDVKTRLGICLRKRRLASEGAAVAAALEAQAAAEVPLRVYRCTLCRQWHLTSRTKGMRLLSRDGQ